MKWVNIISSFLGRIATHELFYRKKFSSFARFKNILSMEIESIFPWIRICHSKKWKCIIRSLTLIPVPCETLMNDNDETDRSLYDIDDLSDLESW